MMPPTKYEQFIELISSFRHPFCHHEITTYFTMDGIHLDKWERISGSGECSRCRKTFHVSIPKDDEEMQRYLSY